jgi:hypothetical protein
MNLTGRYEITPDVREPTRGQMDQVGESNSKRIASKKNQHCCSPSSATITRLKQIGTIESLAVIRARETDRNLPPVRAQVLVDAFFQVRTQKLIEAGAGRLRRIQAAALGPRPPRSARVFVDSGELIGSRPLAESACPVWITLEKAQRCFCQNSSRSLPATARWCRDSCVTSHSTSRSDSVCTGLAPDWAHNIVPSQSREARDGPRGDGFGVGL